MGDGEPSLPVVCRTWKAMQGDPSLSRADKLARIASAVNWAYVPRFYEPTYHEDGTIAAITPTRDDVPAMIRACVIDDLDGTPLPTAPIVPFVETAHDRIAIEIMRGCPWQCRFCQSTVIKRPLRYRTVETIVDAALESYRNTGHDEISLLSLSTSDYPHFEELVTRMSEVFTPLGVKISLPSLRITEMLKKIPALLAEGRRGGLTLAPEVARDDMREQIRKPIDNQDLYDGAAEAFRRGWRKVKLYFMCGLPGERTADLDGIIDMAETIARIGRDVTGRYAEVVASVSNFIPKPHTPYQWNGMQTRDYLRWAHKYLKSRVKIRSVTVKCHDIERSLLEGILTRGDRRVAAGGRGSLAARGAARRLDRALRPEALVGHLRRPRHRRPLLQPPRPPARRGPALGPHPRQEGPRVPGQGADALRRPARSDGRGHLISTEPYGLDLALWVYFRAEVAMRCSRRCGSFGLVMLAGVLSLPMVRSEAQESGGDRPVKSFVVIGPHHVNLDRITFTTDDGNTLIVHFGDGTHAGLTLKGSEAEAMRRWLDGGSLGPVASPRRRKPLMEGVDINTDSGPRRRPGPSPGSIPPRP